MNNRIFASVANIKKSYYSDCDRELKIEYRKGHLKLKYFIYFVDPVTKNYNKPDSLIFECTSLQDLEQVLGMVQEEIAQRTLSDIDSGIVQESVVTIKKIAERYFGGHSILDRDIVHIYSETKSVRSYC